MILMKQKTINLFLILVIVTGLFSCKKAENQTELSNKDNFDYYSYVELRKIELSNVLMGKNKIPRFNFNSKKPLLSKKINKVASNSPLEEPIPELSDNENIDLTSFNLLSVDQIEIAQPLINSMLSNSDDLLYINNLVSNFDMNVAQSNTLSNEDKLLLGQLSAEIQFTIDFFSENENYLYVAEATDGKQIMYLDKSPNSSVSRGGCKVNMRGVLAGAVVGFFSGGVTGAKVGCTVGTFTVPGFGTATGCVGGAVFGAASGFIGGALGGIASELLTSCFRKGDVELVPEEDIVIVFNDEDEPNNQIKLGFPEEYNGEYFYTTSPDYINNPETGPKYSSNIYLREGKYYYNSNKTCLLPTGYYFSNYDDYYYSVVNGEVENINFKPSGTFPDNLYPIEENYSTPFTCNNDF